MRRLRGFGFGPATIPAATEVGAAYTPASTSQILVDLPAQKGLQNVVSYRQKHPVPAKPVRLQAVFGRVPLRARPKPLVASAKGLH